MQSYRTAPKIHTRRPTALIVLAGIVGFASTAHASEIDTLLFGSLDAGGDTFLTLGAKVGLTSLAQEGFVALATVGGGRRTESGADGPRARYTVAAAALAGHQWFFDWGVVAAYAGLETTSEMLIAGPTRDALPTRFGLRLQGEVWARPTAATLLQATAVAGSARDSLWARLAWGYRLWETYLGPRRRSTPTRPATRSGASACTGPTSPSAGTASARRWAFRPSRAGPGLVPT